MDQTLSQDISVIPFKSSITKAGTAIKLCILYIIWNWGIFLLFFFGWCIACYLYFDAVTQATLPPKLQDDLMNTPGAGKVIIVIIAGRKVAIRCNCYVRKLKVKYIKGNAS